MPRGGWLRSPNATPTAASWRSAAAATALRISPWPGAPCSRCWLNRSDALRRLAGFLLPYRYRVAAALGALVVAAACWLALGQGIKHVIDGGFAGGEPRALDQALAGVLGIAAVLALATWLRFYLMMSLGERVVTDLRRAVFGHLLGLEPALFEATRTGEVISRLTNDATLLQQVIGYGLSMFLRNALMMA